VQTRVLAAGGNVSY